MDRRAKFLKELRTNLYLQMQIDYMKSLNRQADGTYNARRVVEHSICLRFATPIAATKLFGLRLHSGRLFFFIGSS